MLPKNFSQNTAIFFFIISLSSQVLDNFFTDDLYAAHVAHERKVILNK